VSVFRPAAKVTSSDGRAWEIYIYRIALSERGDPFDPDLDWEQPVVGGFLSARVAEGEAVVGVLDGVLWFVGLVPRLLVRLLWDVPRAAVRMRGSDVWTVEAITWQPHRTAFTWRTTGEFRRNVVAQVQGQLARGEVPTPRHATYLGETR
jgi:hypothetical protein